jgi:hypothetical protein
MLLFILSRFFVFQLIILLLLALANYFSPLKLGFVQDVLLLPLLTIYLVYTYCRAHQGFLTSAEKTKVFYGLVLSDALIQSVLIFVSPQGMIPVTSFTSAALSYAGIMVFHSLMIYFAIGYSKTLFEKQQLQR